MVGEGESETRVGDEEVRLGERSGAKGSKERDEMSRARAERRRSVRGLNADWVVVVVVASNIVRG